MMESPFKNDPFAMVFEAYKNLYDKPFEARFANNEDDPDRSSEEYGYTYFPLDGSTPTIVIFAGFTVNVCAETLAHELAHIAVGVEHGHDEIWEEAFERIFQEYNRLGNTRFGGDDNA